MVLIESKFYFFKKRSSSPPDSKSCRTALGIGVCGNTDCQYSSAGREVSLVAVASWKKKKFKSVSALVLKQLYSVFI